MRCSYLLAGFWVGKVLIKPTSYAGSCERSPEDSLIVMGERSNILGKAMRLIKEATQASNSPSYRYHRSHAESLIRKAYKDVARPQGSMDLPTLDFSLFLTGSASQKRQLGESLVASFERHSFVKLINHGVPESTIKDYLQGVHVLLMVDQTVLTMRIQTKDLFSLPPRTKRQIQNEKGGARKAQRSPQSCPRKTSRRAMAMI